MRETMKLELKHLAPYLPYGLEVIDLNAKLKHGLNKAYLKSLGSDIIPLEEVQELTLLETHLKIDLMYKPLLRPLSDLKKNGDGAYLSANYGNTPNYYYENLKTKFDVDKQPYCVVRGLLKKHYDVFELIPEGLAIEKKD
jgi:hypothetical protein